MLRATSRLLTRSSTLFETGAGSAILNTANESLMTKAFASNQGAFGLGFTFKASYASSKGADGASEEKRPASAAAYTPFKLRTPGCTDDVSMTPSQKREVAGEGSMVLANPIYDERYLEKITPRHREPTKFSQRIGLFAVQLLRSGFDRATGYGPNMNVDKYLVRFIFLESVAAVPGMVGGALRHLRSLRLMRPDNGWIHSMLQEAENERLHLLTFLQLKQPGFVMRLLVMGAQGVFYNLYFLAYMLSPKTCHSFVGYLEEEAVRTYSHAIEDLRAGRLPEWKDKPAPALAIEYWKLRGGATMEDVLLAVRADERAHEYVNHTLASLNASDKSPFNLHDHTMP